MAEREGEKFNRLMDWQGNIEITVDEFFVEYAGCGSHRMDICIKMDYDNMKSLRDKLTRILDEETYTDEHGLILKKESLLDS